MKWTYASAELDDDLIYRYALWRVWDDDRPYVQFIGLNPSTADAVEDDPTIRKCYGFASRWGYGGFCMTNLFAFRATKPAVMKRAVDPVGPENDQWLNAVASFADIQVAAWGLHGRHRGRDKIVLAMFPNLQCIHVTKDGHPGHPLMLGYDSVLRPYKNEAV